ncbi:MAG: DUF2285 domain-containing protein [Sphingomonas sp.]|uniref:DNA -binding domain-containing protein n=1 Tax=Sphingomonas sp. TaxID=28214 RepID=UPI002272F25E|nr:DUF2285 domain-containing protein [Sphingomonas sp.]MCX8477994.1 DUF2285 domain-containing protein [Sphingomonas sp.]
MTGGFFFAERPDRSAPDALLFWSADVDGSVVSVRAEPVAAADPDAFALARLAGRASLARGDDGREHLLLSDGWRRLRLDVVEGTLLGEGHVRLHFEMAGFAQLEARLLTIRRLLSLWRKERFLHALFQPLAGLAHRLEALRVADARSAGASYREIAVALYGEQRVGAEWEGRSDFLLSRVRRRAAEARRMEKGGYRALLRTR